MEKEVTEALSVLDGAEEES